MNAIDQIRRCRNRCVQIQGSLVIGYFLTVIEEKMQVREALVFLLLDRVAHQIAAK